MDPFQPRSTRFRWPDPLFGGCGRCEWRWQARCCSSEPMCKQRLHEWDGGSSLWNSTFGRVVSYESGGYQASWVAVADVSGDGRPDLLVANRVGVEKVTELVLARATTARL